ncbi:MAG: sugar phosphate nucleotidyltransferase [Victivallaceae bacterium]
MKCLILAAGYATRLYPLTENFPKPLLKVGDKTILDWLLDDIHSSGEIDEYIVISNHKYAAHFVEWAKNKTYKITVFDDGTTSNENRLGAVKDVQYAIDKLHLASDMLIIAGDNVLDFSLKEFIAYAVAKQSSCIMRYFEENREKLKKCGVVTVDSDDLVLEMAEKPQNPASNWCCPPFYYYTEADSSRVAAGIAAGCGTDAPGSYISWLCKVAPVHAMEMPGKRYDIGNLASYEQVKLEYKGIKRK